MRRMPEPSVRTMRHPPLTVPSVMALAYSATTQSGTTKLRICPSRRAADVSEHMSLLQSGFVLRNSTHGLDAAGLDVPAEFTEHRASPTARAAAGPGEDSMPEWTFQIQLLTGMPG